jgi:hypothetical protein
MRNALAILFLSAACAFAQSTNQFTAQQTKTGDQFSNVAHGGGGDAWVSSGALPPDNNFDGGWPNSMELAPVTITTTSTADKLSVYIVSSSVGADVPCKFALYDAAGNWVTTATGVIPDATATSGVINAYIDLTISDTAVTPQIYSVAINANQPGGIILVGSKTGTDLTYTSQAYAGFPPSTLPTATHFADHLMLARIHLK